MKEKIIQTTFLVPLKEDDDIGNGKLHPESRWQELQKIMYVGFGGWTIAHDFYLGGWVNPNTGKKIEDQSRKYFVDIKKKELNKMREIMRWVAREFKQQCIRFEHESEVEYIPGVEE